MRNAIRPTLNERGAREKEKEREREKEENCAIVKRVERGVGGEWKTIERAKERRTAADRGDRRREYAVGERDRRRESVRRRCEVAEEGRE